MNIDSIFGENELRGTSAKEWMDPVDGGEYGEPDVDQLADHCEHSPMKGDIVSKCSAQDLERLDVVVDPLH